MVSRVRDDAPWLRRELLRPLYFAIWLLMLFTASKSALSQASGQLRETTLICGNGSSAGEVFSAGFMKGCLSPEVARGPGLFCDGVSPFAAGCVVLATTNVEADHLKYSWSTLAGILRHGYERNREPPARGSCVGVGALDVAAVHALAEREPAVPTRDGQK